MAWHSTISPGALEEIFEALAVLNHHKFFDLYRDQIEKAALNGMRDSDDADLARNVRKYQAQQDMLAELNQVAEEAMAHVADHTSGEERE